MSFAAVALILTAVGQQKPVKGLYYEYKARPSVMWQVAPDDPIAGLAPLVVSEFRYLMYHGKSTDGRHEYQVHRRLRVALPDVAKTAEILIALLGPKGYKLRPDRPFIYHPKDRDVTCWIHESDEDTLVFWSDFSPSKETVARLKRALGSRGVMDLSRGGTPSFSDPPYARPIRPSNEVPG